MEPKKETDCPCNYTDCERYGDCAACMEHHHSFEEKPLTACERQTSETESISE